MDQGDFATLSLQTDGHDVMGIFFAHGPPLGLSLGNRQRAPRLSVRPRSRHLRRNEMAKQ